eukprot:3094236-Pleurochrysis_carterae.AAC.1
MRYVHAPACAQPCAPVRASPCSLHRPRRACRSNRRPPRETAAPADERRRTQTVAQPHGFTDTQPHSVARMRRVQGSMHVRHVHASLNTHVHAFGVVCGATLIGTCTAPGRGCGSRPWRGGPLAREYADACMRVGAGKFTTGEL